MFDVAAESLGCKHFFPDLEVPHSRRVERNMDDFQLSTIQDESGCITYTLEYV